MILHWRGLYWQSFLSPTIVGNASLSQKIFLTCILIGWWYNEPLWMLKKLTDYISKAAGWLVFPCLMSDNNWGPLSFICSCLMPTENCILYSAYMSGLSHTDRPHTVHHILAPCPHQLWIMIDLFLIKRIRYQFIIIIIIFWSKIQWTKWSYCYLLLELT